MVALQQPSRLCTPQFETLPTPGRENRLTEFRALARMMDMTLMPWQEQVIRVATEFDRATGFPHYRECAVTVPRQSGKTLLLLLFMLDRALYRARPQRIAYTAQTGQDARKKLTEDLYDGLLRWTPLDGFVKQVKYSMADSAIIFETGSRIDALATSVESGHGKTLDLAVIDEAMADDDDRREQGLLPALATKRDAQLLVFSTAGTDKSLLLRRKVDAGRAAVERGDREGICYFEWSAPADLDPSDFDRFPEFHPALGHTQDISIIKHAFTTMADSEFRRAYMNQWTKSDERVIPVEAWDAVQDVSATPSGKMVFALDAHPDRSFASIAVADSLGRGEVVERRPGIDWLKSRVPDLAAKYGAEVVVDKGGPVGRMISHLEDAGVVVVPYGATDYAYACAAFFDFVMEGLVHIRPDPDGALDRAVAAAKRRPMVDAWAWSRRDEHNDISPLVALTLAMHRAFEPTGGGPVTVNVEFL